MPLIVIEGLDGSGKATNANALYEKLESLGKRVKKISFPDYDSDSSALVKMYLAGDFGKKATDVNAYAASAFYAVDRFASFKTGWETEYNRGDFIIADRYTTSNAVHQSSKLEGAERDAYFEWLYDFEFGKMGLPRPDAVIYLDVLPEVSQRLMSERYSGDENKKDIHEADTEYLKNSRQAALYAAKKLGWQVVSLCENGEMLSREAAFARVFDKIKELYGTEL